MSKYAPAKLNGVEGIGFVEITGEEKPFDARGVFTSNDDGNDLEINLREAEFEGMVWYGDNYMHRPVKVTTRIISHEPMTYDLTVKAGISLSDIGVDESGD